MTDTDTATSALADRLADVRDALEQGADRHRRTLEALVRIPSISADPTAGAELRRSAEAVLDALSAVGLEGARLLEAEDAPPAVYAEHLHAEGAPTVLLYAHHDVQPTGPVDRWTSPPFEPTERAGRLFGRGTADDKAGVVVHLAAVDAWLRARGGLPVNVKVFIEGEEEVGSEHLPAFLECYADLLRADVMILTDSTNWQVGVPAVTSSLRGLTDCVVEVRALDHAVHSGMYGGAAPDPLTGLVKLLAGMTDEHGAPAIPGVVDGVPEPTPRDRASLEALDFDEARFRQESGLLDGVALGRPGRHPLEEIWWRPNVTILAVDAPSVEEASNTLQASARAKVSLRTAPGQDSVAAGRALVAWLEANVPWGLHISVEWGGAGTSFRGDPEHPTMQAAARALGAAYGAPAVFIGVGGSIPFIEPFATAFGGVPALLTGVEDPDTRAHGIDESLHLGDFAKACLGEAYLLAELAEVLSPSPGSRS